MEKPVLEVGQGNETEGSSTVGKWESPQGHPCIAHHAFLQRNMQKDQCEREADLPIRDQPFFWTPSPREFAHKSWMFASGGAPTQAQSCPNKWAVKWSRKHVQINTVFKIPSRLRGFLEDMRVDEKNPNLRRWLLFPWVPPMYIWSVHVHELCFKKVSRNSLFIVVNLRLFWDKTEKRIKVKVWELFDLLQKVRFCFPELPFRDLYW